MATIKERLEDLNALRVTNGEKPLKSWSKSGDALEERIAKLKSELSAKSVAAAIDDEEKTPAGKAAKKQSANAPVSKRRSESMADVIRPYLLETDLSNQEIYDKIVADKPTFFDQKRDGEVIKDGRKWHIAWYRAQLHRKGLL